VSSAKRRGRIIVVLYALCALYLVPVFPHFLSANELTRWAAAAGLVERGSLEVSWAERIIGPPMDVARSDSRLYSNKAPGLTFLAAVPYALVRPLLGPPSTHNLRWSLYAMRVVSVTIPAVVLGAMLLRRCENDAMAVTTALFATPLFVFGTLLFSHVTATALLYGAYILSMPEEDAGATRRRAALGGFLAGLATVTEYTAALGALGIAATLAATRQGRRRLAPYVAGGVPLALALGVYNTLLFGSPLSLSSAHEAAPDLAAQAAAGLYGVGAPSLARLEGLLLSPSRGLLFFSPILVFGLVALAPRRPFRARAWFRLAFVALLVAAMAGYPGWHGGWGVGSRYLLLAVPFLVEAAHERAVRPGLVTAACLVYSAILCVSPALSLPLAPNEFELLHSTFTRPLLAAGFATPNLGWLVARGLPTLLPVVAAVLLALSLALLPGPRRVVAGAVAAVLLAAVVFALPGADRPDIEALRALLLDTHFTATDRLGALLRRARDPRVRTMLESYRNASAATREVGPDDWPYAVPSDPPFNPPPGSAGATGTHPGQGPAPPRR
jgi:hypothetical protein